MILIVYQYQLYRHLWLIDLRVVRFVDSMVEFLLAHTTRI